MYNQQDYRSDHPTLRTLFYVGILAFGFMLLTAVEMESWARWLIFIAVCILAGFIVYLTENFWNWGFGGPDMMNNVASAVSVIYMIFGAVLLFALILFIPWLINGIKRDLR